MFKIFFLQAKYDEVCMENFQQKKHCLTDFTDVNRHKKLDSHEKKNFCDFVDLSKSSKRFDVLKQFCTTILLRNICGHPIALYRSKNGSDRHRRRRFCYNVSVCVPIRMTFVYLTTQHCSLVAAHASSYK